MFSILPNFKSYDCKSLILNGKELRGSEALPGWHECWYTAFEVKAPENKTDALAEKESVSQRPKRKREDNPKRKEGQTCLKQRRKRN